MLQRLRIRNYAIIDELEIGFAEGMNILTGETGAGKSIILGALSLILGERQQSGAAFRQDSKSIAEAEFDIGSYALQGFFESNELDYDRHTIIRREILPSGKSRAFINDSPAPLSTVRELGNRLVDLNRQHEVLKMRSRDFAYLFTDSMAGILDQREAYRSDYREWKNAQRELEKRESRLQQSMQEADYLRFQLKELEEAALEELPEADVLEREIRQLNNAGDIKERLQLLIQQLRGDERNLLDQLGSMGGELSALQQFGEDYAKLADRIESSRIELGDIADEIEQLDDRLQLDEEEMQLRNDQWDRLNRLLKKHLLTETADLIKLREELSDQLNGLDHSDREIEARRAEIERMESALRSSAVKLSSARKAVKDKAEQAVQQLLERVGMPNAIFGIQLESCKLQEFGSDEVSLMFSANKGVDAREISKVASGGEMSRLMLCIKSLIAEGVALPTLIFDEIDTGVSGEVALQVGGLMQQLGGSHQLIVITHLPQIAGKGEKHLQVYKTEIEGLTRTRIRELDPEARVVEIAKMLSGEDYSEASLQNASELVNDGR